MVKMISKELLSEVLKQVCNPLLFDEQYNTLYYHNDYGNKARINAYELAHKSKEWAKSVYNNIDFMVYGKGQCDLTIFTQPDDIKYNFNADTEIEAIFKACEWILKNKKLLQ